MAQLVLKAGSRCWCKSDAGLMQVWCNSDAILFVCWKSLKDDAVAMLLLWVGSLGEMPCCTCWLEFLDGYICRSHGRWIVRGPWFLLDSGLVGLLAGVKRDGDSYSIFSQKCLRQIYELIKVLGKMGTKCRKPKHWVNQFLRKPQQTQSILNQIQI